MNIQQKRDVAYFVKINRNRIFSRLLISFSNVLLSDITHSWTYLRYFLHPGSVSWLILFGQLDFGSCVHGV